MNQIVLSVVFHQAWKILDMDVDEEEKSPTKIQNKKRKIIEDFLQLFNQDSRYGSPSKIYQSRTILW